MWVLFSVEAVVDCFCGGDAAFYGAVVNSNGGVAATRLAGLWLEQAKDVVDAVFAAGFVKINGLPLVAHSDDLLEVGCFILVRQAAFGKQGGVRQADVLGIFDVDSFDNSRYPVAQYGQKVGRGGAAA